MSTYGSCGDRWICRTASKNKGESCQERPTITDFDSGYFWGTVDASGAIWGTFWSIEDTFGLLKAVLKTLIATMDTIEHF